MNSGVAERGVLFNVRARKQEPEVDPSKTVFLKKNKKKAQGAKKLLQASDALT